MQKHDSGFELKLEPGAYYVRAGSLADLRPAFQKVEEWMRVLGFHLMDILAVQLSVREAAANAVRHGSRGDPFRQVEVRRLVTRDEVIVEVEDEGPGFDRSQVSDPFTGGHAERRLRMGDFMMRRHMNWVHYNARGNRVTLGRRRSAS